MTSQFSVPGIKCDGCVHAIIDGFKDVDGLETISVDKNKKTIEIVHTTSLSQIEIKNRLSKLGYPVK